MKRSGRELPSKAHFSHFFQLNCSNFRLKQCGGLRVAKMVKEIQFEEIWGELESEKGFQSQSVIKYLRLTLVFT